MPAPFTPRPDRLATAFLGAALVATAVAAFVTDATPEWSRSRDEVRRVVAQRLGAARAARISSDLEQVWLPEWPRVDRCVACHAAIDAGPELLDAAQPARSHPVPALLAAHPVERFGCTLCHGGQGAATTKAAAHGDVAFWDEPLLGRTRASWYALSAADLMQTNCNLCHRRDEKTEGMTLVDEAKALVKAKRCVSCHRIDGKGGAEGPDLTREGDKTPERFAFPSGFDGQRSTLGWHLAHFLDPAAVVPGSEMPVFHFTERQATGLALLVMSWRSAPVPSAWVPDPARKPVKK